MGEFVLQRRHWRGQIVVRFGPSRECFDIRIQNGNTRYLFTMPADPRDELPIATFLWPEPQKTITTIDTEHIDPFAIPIGRRIGLLPEPNNPNSANPTKATPAWITTLDAGKAEILDDRPEFKKFKLSGIYLTGTFVFLRESQESDIWELRRSPPVVMKTAEESGHDVRLFKSDQRRRIVWGVVLEPNETDLHGHIITEKEIEDAVEWYMLKSQAFDYEHHHLLNPEDARVVQCFVAPCDLEWTLDDGSVVHFKKGTWLLAAKVFNDGLWEQIVSGEINAFSIHAFGKLRPLNTGEP